MTQQTTAAANSTNGQSAARELFALTDEQILEIEPEAEPSGLAPAVIPSEARNLSSSATDQVAQSKRDSSSSAAPRNDRMEQNASDATATSHESPAASHHAAEPPRWVAEAMNDPQRGREARAFWEGAQKAQQEAAAYREVFAKPEEARSAAERARVLDDIDRAYFAGDANQRTQLAAMMLREDPAAFREMVFEGLRALEETGKQGSTEAGNVTAATGGDKTAVHAGQQSSHDPSRRGELGMTSGDDAQNAQLAAYAAFEKAANEDLERSVGSAIERTLEHALPNTGRASDGPMKGRLAATIRQDVEKALQGDRQLGEQVARILSARRLDNETRAQVVRLIGERAEQLVPSAAKRALNDWTQTTLAAHRSRTRQNESAASRSDLAPAKSDATIPRLQAGDNSRPSVRNDNRGGKGSKVDYRKLSDEQILEM